MSETPGCSTCEESRKKIDLKITVGMAVYDDFATAAMTIQSLRMHQPTYDARNLEIVVVDNRPDGRQGERLKGFCTATGCKYVPFPSPVGTSASRDEIFRHATGEVVVVIDSHVMLPLATLQRLRIHAMANPDNMDLWHGPMLLDAITPGAMHTHMRPEWGEDLMFGKWDTDERAFNDKNPPFEIPMHGLGLFACRRSAWLGFPSGLKGFGGEEGMVHELWRQHGRKVLCLPFLSWWHLFRDEKATTPYPCKLDDRLRNYVLWHKYLGIDPEQAISRYRAHAGDRFIRDTLRGMEAECKLTPYDVYQRVSRSPTDIQEHLPTLLRLAKNCERITELGTRYATSTTALLAGHPSRLITYDRHPSEEAKRLLPLATQAGVKFETRIGDSRQIDIEPTDLLFIDTLHTREQLAQELERHAEKSQRYIVLHDTVTYGDRGEDGREGILPAIREYVKEHPHWNIAENWPNNNGLMVLSRSSLDAKPLPALITQGANYLQARWKRMGAEQKNVDEYVFGQRLNTCWLCTYRAGGKCSACGCPVAEKAAWATEACPKGFWPAGNEAAAAPPVTLIEEEPAPVPARIDFQEQEVETDRTAETTPPLHYRQPEPAVGTHAKAADKVCQHVEFESVVKINASSDGTRLALINIKCKLCGHPMIFDELGNVAQARLSISPVPKVI